MSATTLERIRDLIDPLALAPEVDQPREYLELSDTHSDRWPGSAAGAIIDDVMTLTYEYLWGRRTRVTSDLAADDPHCWATDENSSNDARVLLDVACGRRGFTPQVADRLDTESLAIGLDCSAPAIVEAAARNRYPQVGYVRGDPRTLPFDDELFDFTSCFNVAPSLYDPYQVLGEMIRVLTPGGRLAVAVTTAQSDKTAGNICRLMAHGSNVRVFEPARVISVLRASAFDTITLHFCGQARYISAAKSRVAQPNSRASPAVEDMGDGCESSYEGGCPSPSFLCQVCTLSSHSLGGESSSRRAYEPRSKTAGSYVVKRERR